MGTIMRSRKWLWTTLVVLLSAALVTAQDAGKEQTEDRALEEETALSVDVTPRKAIALSMRDAITLTLKNNMNIRISEINPKTAAADITGAEAQFDWSFVGSYAKSYSMTPQDDYETTGDRDRASSDKISVGLKKSLTTGGAIEPTLSWTRSGQFPEDPDDTNPLYTTSAYIKITQPLLRNAGSAVTLSNVRAARNNAEIARYNFRTNVINTLSEMQRTYWDLVFAIEDLNVKKKSLRLTKDTLAQTRAQVDAGILARIETTRVRADVATKEEAILNAQRTVEDSEDEIRRFINKRGSNLANNVGVVPLERAGFKPVRIDLTTEISQALMFRPDYLSAKIALKNRDIEIVVAKNGKLPVVDVSATLGLNGYGGDTGITCNAMKTRDFYNWSGGVSVEVPLGGNRAARSGYLKALLAKRKALDEITDLEHEIIINVKQAARQVVTNHKRIRSSRLARELAEERLQAEEEKFRVGEAVILDVLEAQTLLAENESNERRAIVDYNKSLISLEAAKGTLLVRDRIIVDTRTGRPSMR